MTALEKKRKEAELMSVRAARVNLEFKILELEDQIERLRLNIDIQKNKEQELEKEIGGEI